MSLPAVLYAAKSTVDRHGSIGEQLEDCRQMAAENGWEIVGEFTDENFTAYTGNRGPGLAAAIEAAKAVATPENRAMLVAQHTSRFARGDGAAPDAPRALVELWHEWARADVRGRLVENDTAMSSSTAAAIQGEADHSESKRKSTSVRKGMARRRRKGLLHGRPPVGYVNVEGRLIVDEGEAAIVRRIYREWLSGRSQQSIARALEAEGVRTKRGGHWYQATVSTVLSRRYVVGDVPDGDGWIQGEHEAIISREDWELAARLRETTYRAGRGRRPSKSMIFKSGYLQCGVCGAAMIPRSDRQTYSCLTNKRRGPGSCSMPVVSAKLIDTAVIDDFQANWLDVEATRERLRSNYAAWTAEAATMLDEAEREAQRAQERHQRVRRAFQDGEITAGDWSEQRDGLRDELQAAEAQVQAMRQREAQVAADVAQRDVEAEMLRALAGLREAGSVDQVRAVLQTLFARFEIKHDPMVAWRRKTFPDIPSPCSFTEHGGLTITPYLRPEIVEYFPGNGYRVDRLALPVPDFECEGLYTHYTARARAHPGP